MFRIIECWVILCLFKTVPFYTAGLLAFSVLSCYSTFHKKLQSALLLQIKPSCSSFNLVVHTSAGQSVSYMLSKQCSSPWHLRMSSSFSKSFVCPMPFRFMSCVPVVVPFDTVIPHSEPHDCNPDSQFPFCLKLGSSVGRWTIVFLIVGFCWCVNTLWYLETCALLYLNVGKWNCCRHFHVSIPGLGAQKQTAVQQLVLESNINSETFHHDGAGDNPPIS